MDFQTLFASAALIALIFIVLPITFFVFSPRKPELPAPSIREYLPGGIIFPMFRDFRNAGDVIERARETYGEVFAYWFGPTRLVCTSVPQDIVQVVSSTQEFRRADAALCAFETLAPGGIFTMIGESHRAARKSMRAQFNHTMLQSFHSKMTEATSELCASLSDVAGKDAVDLWKFLAVATFRIITNVAFGAGMGREERMKFNAATDMLVDEMVKDVIGYPLLQKLTFLGVRENHKKNIQSISGMCLKFIERRLADRAAQKSRNLDVLDTILDMSKGDINLAISLTIEFAIAGSHTTSQILTWTIYDICCNPRVEKKLCDELDTVVGDRLKSQPVNGEDVKKLKYVRQVWKESLRRRPVVRFLMREAKQDVQLRGSGVQLPKGTSVAALQAYCHLDPRFWKKPLEFRPERWEEDGKSEGYRVPAGAYLPFGVGEHSCAGKFLADYEGPLIIAELYRRFKFELACKPEEVKVRTQFVERAQYVHGGVEEGVPIKVYLRQ